MIACTPFHAIGTRIFLLTPFDHATGRTDQYQTDCGNPSTYPLASRSDEHPSWTSLSATQTRTTYFEDCIFLTFARETQETQDTKSDLVTLKPPRPPEGAVFLSRCELFRVGFSRLVVHHDVKPRYGFLAVLSHRCLGNFRFPGCDFLFGQLDHPGNFHVRIPLFVKC